VPGRGFFRVLFFRFRFVPGRGSLCCLIPPLMVSTPGRERERERQGGREGGREGERERERERASERASE
jgi:hypothetical protein